MNSPQQAGGVNNLMVKLLGFRQAQWIAMIVSAGLIGAPGPKAIATPATAETYRVQGLNYRQQGRFDEAISALQTAVELEPQSVSGHVILGWTQHLATQEQAAESTLTTALTLDPFDVQVSNALGIVHLVQGNLYQALLTHLWAAHLKPDNEIAYFNLSLAAQRINYHEWAIELAARAVELEPYNPHPLIAEAIAHWSLGNRETAQELYRKAIVLNPRYGTLQGTTFLGAAAFNSDQIQTARRIIND